MENSGNLIEESTLDLPTKYTDNFGGVYRYMAGGCPATSGSMFRVSFSKYQLESHDRDLLRASSPPYPQAFTTHCTTLAPS
jgi:hypothetical protein